MEVIGVPLLFVSLFTKFYLAYLTMVAGCIVYLTV